MKLVDKISAKQGTFFTFEFFPPRTDQGFHNLVTRISRLATLDPLAISITWGAGGGTKERSLELATLTQSECKVDTILHLTCTNMEKGMVDEALTTARDNGIQNILALRGDPPRGKEYWMASDPRFSYAVDLVSYIRSSEFSKQFCIGVAAYPDGHVDRETDEDGELDYLKAKVDAGGDFIITQLFYDVDNYIRWQKKVRAKGISVPIIPGIMPIQTYSSFLRLTKLCGSRVPPSIQAALELISHDDQLIKDFGVNLAVDMIKRLVAEGDVPGVHFCTLNLEKSVQRVLEDLGWIKHLEEDHNRLIVEGSTRRDSDFTMSPTTATDTARKGLTNIHKGSVEAGKGELNQAAVWDDFPNGRFGDFKSPAYGDYDPWGNMGISRTEAVRHWGDPKTIDNLNDMFLRHLCGDIPATPFSSTPLSPESMTILPQLEKLTKKGWWTVGSQPAVDSAKSSDKLFGWGPKNGHVFQKGFVEFFATKDDVSKIIGKINGQGKGWVHYFAGNDEGECLSNVPDNGRNAVTWGVFPGQEVTQSTIIERESFLAWKDEAFSIWAEWASFYQPGSSERTLLEDIRNDRWLVSVVHHDYKSPNALWDFLFSETYCI